MLICYGQLRELQILPRMALKVQMCRHISGLLTGSYRAKPPPTPNRTLKMYEDDSIYRTMCLPSLPTYHKVYGSTLYIGMAMVYGLCPYIWTTTISVIYARQDQLCKAERRMLSCFGTATDLLDIPGQMTPLFMSIAIYMY